MVERTQRARELRRTSTKAEGLLWAQLRNRRLGGFKFRRQWPVEHYYADFACVERRLIVELDGEGHLQTFAHDFARGKSLARAGYRTLRIPNEEVFRNLDGVLQTILNALKDE